jgi:hypothetical protein
MGASALRWAGGQWLWEQLSSKDDPDGETHGRFGDQAIVGPTLSWKHNHV